MVRVLEEIHGAASRCAQQKKEHSTTGGADVAAIAVDECAALLMDVDDPNTPSWHEAMASANREKWLEGAQEELTSLHEMSIFQLVPRSEVPTDCKVLRRRFVCRLKRNENGNPVQHKVQWVAKGFQQIWGKDFSKTTSPTARLESMRSVLHITVCNDWQILQYDVKTAFLNSVLPDNEIQYMQQPPDFAEPGKESHVWKLFRGLYGMRQSS